MTTKILGRRTSMGPVVMVSDEQGLRPLARCVRHSPTGFEWGYGGSGPADLALAILTFVAGEDVALCHYQDFKEQVVAHLPDSFTLDLSTVVTWLESAGVEGEQE